MHEKKEPCKSGQASPYLVIPMKTVEYRLSFLVSG